MRKYEGEVNGIPLYSDPNAPIRDELDTGGHTNCSCTIILLNRWQRFKNWFRRLVR